MTQNPETPHDNPDLDTVFNLGALSLRQICRLNRALGWERHDTAMRDFYANYKLAERYGCSPTDESHKVPLLTHLRLDIAKCVASDLEWGKELAVELLKDAEHVDPPLEDYALSTMASVAADIGLQDYEYGRDMLIGLNDMYPNSDSVLESSLELRGALAPELRADFDSHLFPDGL